MDGLNYQLQKLVKLGAAEASEAELSEMFDQLISSVDDAMHNSSSRAADASEQLRTATVDVDRAAESARTRFEGDAAPVPPASFRVAAPRSTRKKTPGKSHASPGSRFAARGTFSERGTPQTSRVRLNSRPTPYEVWSATQKKRATRSATPRTATSRKRATNAAEQAAVAERMMSVQRQKVFERMEHEQRKAAEEERACTFQPVINSASKRMVPRHTSRIHERYQEEIDRRAAHAAEATKRIDAYKMQDVTFAPNMRQTKAANAHLAASGRGASGRVEDRCVQFALDKEIAHERMRERRAREEDELCTFTPRINASSRDAVTTRFKSSTRAIVATGTRADPGHEEETFQPRLATAGRASARRSPDAPRRPVHERLYEESERRAARRGGPGGDALAPSLGTPMVAPASASARARTPAPARARASARDCEKTVAEWAPGHYFLYRALADAEERELRVQRSPLRRGRY